MKPLVLAILLLIAPIFCHADMGSAYIFQVEVTYDKGVAQGYFQIVDYIDIDSAQAEAFLRNDSLFGSFFKQSFHQDSLYLYKSLYRIDSLYVNIFFNDGLMKIDKNQIRRLHLKSVREGYVGSWVEPAYYSVKDLSWLKKPYLYKEEYYYDMCTYTLYYFKKLKSSHPFEKEKKKYLGKGIEHWSGDDAEEWGKLLNDYIQFIRKQKVLIKAECGC